MPNGLDDWTANYLRQSHYVPECGIPDCTNCTLRDSYGLDYDGFDSEGYNGDGYNRDGEDRNGRTLCQNGECYDCYECEQSRHDDRLLSYSYRPTLRFNGDKAPYYGMELEVTTDDISAAIDVVEANAPRLIYCKEDSSVQGLELVTHPMSYPWAMDNFPWPMLTELRTNAGATVIGEDNGIHIHVGRDGFDNSAHMFRWMKFWYRNPRDIQRMGRRRASNWGGFSPMHRAAHKEHVKRNKPSYNYRRDSTMAERYAAINTQNEATLEVRVFASTLRPQRAKAALQLVAGSVEYARQLTPDAVIKRHGWDWLAFMSWASKSDTDYTALLAEHRLRRYL